MVEYLGERNGSLFSTSHLAVKSAGEFFDTETMFQSFETVLLC